MKVSIPLRGTPFTSNPLICETTEAAHDEIGAIIQIGAAVASII